MSLDAENPAVLFDADEWDCYSDAEKWAYLVSEYAAQRRVVQGLIKGCARGLFEAEFGRGMAVEYNLPERAASFERSTRKHKRYMEKVRAKLKSIDDALLELSGPEH